MNGHSLRRTFLALIGAIALASCAGGGETGTGIDGSPITTQGTITGFGSVYLNGVKYEVGGNTAISVEDADGDEGQLAVGMVVTLDGTINADGTGGTADRIVYESEVKGIVDALPDPNLVTNGTGTISVMGQTVNVVAETTFKGTTAATIAKDNVVEVSGFSDGAGNIFATRIELKDTIYDGTSDVEIKGTVDSGSVDPIAGTFTLNNVTVKFNIGGESDFTDINQIQAGMYLDVRGVYDLVNGRIDATRIELEGDSGKPAFGQEGDEIEIEGYITAIIDPNTFALNGYQVSYTADALEGVLALDASHVGQKAEVHGRLNASGVLVAEEIELKQQSDGTELSGKVQNIDLVNNTLTLDANATVPNAVIKVTATTIYEDDRDENGTVVPDHYFNFSKLAIGDWVEVRVYLEGVTYIATRLERDDDPQSPSQSPNPEEPED